MKHGVRSGLPGPRRAREAAAGAVLYSLFASPFGPFAVVWRPRGDRAAAVIRIFLPRGRIGAERQTAAAFPGSGPGSCSEIADLGRRIAAFLAGDAVELGIDRVELSRCPAFQRMVLEAEAAIPRGWTSSYGRIARRIGRPGAARAVGTALARNPFPIIIPCHRAIREDGALGGFQGGVAMKRALLEHEGIRFDASGRVRPDRIYY